MSSILFFIYFIIILTSLLLIINFIFAVHKPYKQKNGPFECGYDSFQQTRMQFSIVFITFGLMFMLFDLEIVMITPMMVNIIEIEGFGLSVVIAFILILTLGFVFELGKNALKIETKQEKEDHSSSTLHTSN